MRLKSSLRRIYFLYLLLAAALAAGTALSAQGTTSVIKGTVYSPLGPGNGDPIPNILVYIPTKALTPFAPDSGPQSCDAQASLVSGLPALGSATTDAAGNFTITGDSLPASVNIVIQAGKWRRQYPATAITVGGTTTLNLTMPGQSGPLADLPHIAIVTGSVDTVECIFRRIGISDSEFTSPGGGGSINLYEGLAIGYNGQPAGGALVDQNASPVPTEATLMESTATINKYDVVMFGCQGTASDDIPNENKGGSLDNLVNYANNGGRVFATHFGYVWLDNIEPFESAANWQSNDPLTSSQQEGQVATIDQTYPEGEVLANWIQNIGASYNNTLGEVYLDNVREDTSAVNNPPSQSWATLTNISGHPSMQFTFDTPVSSSGVPTVAISYQNGSATFLQGDVADTVAIGLTNTSTTATSSGLTLILSIPAGISPTSLMGKGNTGWTCNLATLTCTRAAALAPAASDPITLVFNISQTAPLGSTTIKAALSGGGLTNTNQCGRVLYNDYHVEDTDDLTNQNSYGYTYPQECNSGPLTPQEKFLEFSLYNLSNFVAPTTTDTFVIQGKPVITWPQPAAIPYGTPLSSTQLDATANVPGTFVYTPASPTVPNAGNQTLSVVFTPTDSVDYTTATASVLLEVQKAGTETSIAPLVTPIYYGQEIGFTNGINSVASAVALNPALSIPDGTISVFVDGVDECNLTVKQSAACPDAGFEGFDVGQHTIEAVYEGDANFAASTPANSPTYTVTVVPDSTTVALSTSASPSYVGMTVTLTATATNTAPFTDKPHPAPVGVVSIFDNGTPLGTAILNSQGAASIATSSLALGAHSITATYTPDSDFLTSIASPINQVVINPPPTPLPTATTLQSSKNPSALGQSVTFTAATATTGSLYVVGTGAIAFTIDGKSVATVALDPRGQASFTTAANFLTVGTHLVVATYAGSTANNLAASTGGLSQQVQSLIGGITPGFLLTVTPTTFSVGAGNYITASVTVTEINGFAEPVQLGCSGLPKESTCTFTYQGTSSAGGTTPLIIHAAAPHNCDSNDPYFVAGLGGRTGLPILAVITLAFFARRRKALKGLLLAAAICVLPAISGCGLGNCTDLAAKPGTYTFNVTGTSQGPNAITQTQVMTMTITI